jgi:hypothetical protein
MKLEFLDRFYPKYSSIKFHEIPSSGSRVVSCGETDGQTDMTKLIVTFCSYANAPNNVQLYCTEPECIQLRIMIL